MKWIVSPIAADTKEGVYSSPTGPPTVTVWAAAVVAGTEVTGAEVVQAQIVAAGTVTVEVM